MFKNFRKDITLKVPNNTIGINSRITLGRELGYRQLKEAIYEVYPAKERYGDKYSENKIANETGRLPLYYVAKFLDKSKILSFYSMDCKK